MDTKKLIFAYFVLLFGSNILLYYEVYMLSNLVKILTGIVLFKYLSQYISIFEHSILYYLVLSLLFIYGPFLFSYPLIYSSESNYIYFIFLANFFEIQVFRKERVNLFRRNEFQWVFFLLILLFIILIEIINSSKLSDFQFYLYLSIAIMQIIHIWMSYNRQLPPVALNYSILASIFFILAEYIYACNILITSNDWHKYSMIIVDVIYSIGLFLFIQSFILDE